MKWFMLSPFHLPAFLAPLLVPPFYYRPRWFCQALEASHTLILSVWLKAILTLLLLFDLILHHLLHRLLKGFLIPSPGLDSLFVYVLCKYLWCLSKLTCWGKSSSESTLPVQSHFPFPKYRDHLWCAPHQHSSPAMHLPNIPDHHPPPTSTCKQIYLGMSLGDDLESLDRWQERPTVLRTWSQSHYWGDDVELLPPTLIDACVLWCPAPSALKYTSVLTIWWFYSANIYRYIYVLVWILFPTLIGLFQSTVCLPAS